jgi:hypothetical protein
MMALVKKRIPTFGDSVGTGANVCRGFKEVSSGRNRKAKTVGCYEMICAICPA